MTIKTTRPAPTPESLDERLTSIEIVVQNRFDAIDKRFDEVDQRFDALEGRLGVIEGKIDLLIERSDPAP